MPDPKPEQIERLENYLFDRYIHTILRIILPLALTIMPVLLPLNFYGNKDQSTNGLDRLSFANRATLHINWYWVHLLAAISVVVFVCLVLQFELQSYTRFEEDSDATQKEGTVILISSQSRNQLTVESIQHHFKTIPVVTGSIKINRDYRSMHEKERRREELIMKLEAAETCLIRRAQQKSSLPSPRTDWLLRRSNLLVDDRPTMRLPPDSIFLPFGGTRVDTIYYCRTEIVRYSQDIELGQQQPHLFPLLNSAFLQLKHRVSIPLPLLALKAGIPPSWTLKQGTAPSDIIWPNIPVSWWEQFARMIIVYSAVAAIVFGFGFPVTFVGSLSQLSYLTTVMPALAWLDHLPSWLLGCIQGILPPAMLALVTAVVPTILRLLAGLHGFCSRQAIESAIQAYYFIFLFVQVFLVISLSASTTGVLEQIRKEVEFIPTMLVQNLPKASNYFLSYLLIHTSGTVTSTLLLPKYLLNLLLSPMRDKSARQKWYKREEQYMQRWGTALPVYTNLACICMFCLSK